MRTDLRLRLGDSARSAIHLRLQCRTALRSEPARSEGRLQPRIEFLRKRILREANALNVRTEKGASISHSHHRMNSISGGNVDRS